MPVISAPEASAGPADVYDIYGSVTDVLGNELAGVTVRNGGQVTATDAAGDYRLGQTATGTFTLRASRSDLAAATRTVDILVPQDTRADFVMLYAHQPTLSPNLLSTAEQAVTVAVEVTGTAPDPDDTCVWLRHGDQETQAAQIPGVSPPRWETELVIPQGTAEGLHRVDHWAEVCSTGEVISWVGHANYEVDNTAPTLSAPTPTSWTKPEAIIGVTAGDLVGVDTARSYLELDGTQLNGSWTGYRLQASTSALEPGTHTARAVIRDYAGNTNDITWTFTVDPDAPELTGPSPTGTIEGSQDSTPTLSVHAEDRASGIASSSVQMWISRGPLRTRVDAVYNRASDAITYQVPDQPRGIGVGQGPLLPGSYTVEVQVADRVGWTAATSWTFEVEGPPPVFGSEPRVLSVI